MLSLYSTCFTTLSIIYHALHGSKNESFTVENQSNHLLAADRLGSSIVYSMSTRSTCTYACITLSVVAYYFNNLYHTANDHVHVYRATTKSDTIEHYHSST